MDRFSSISSVMPSAAADRGHEPRPPRIEAPRRCRRAQGPEGHGRCSTVIPSATMSTTVATGMRIPRLVGTPAMTSGSTVIRVNSVPSWHAVARFWSRPRPRGLRTPTRTHRGASGNVREASRPPIRAQRDPRRPPLNRVNRTRPVGGSSPSGRTTWLVRGWWVTQTEPPWPTCGSPTPRRREVRCTLGQEPGHTLGVLRTGP